MRTKNREKTVFQEKPWIRNDNNIWLASLFHLYRNIEKFSFPAKLEREKRKQIVSLITRGLLKTDIIPKPIVLKAEEMTPLEKEYLVEHFLSPHSFHLAHSGEAFILDDTGEFLSVLNLLNHVEYLFIDCHGELERAWNHLVKIETGLGKFVKYSFSPRFGFLTSDPMVCGTAFQLTVFLQLSALVHTGKLQETLGRLCHDGISVTGLQGDPEEIIGDVLAVRNNYTLGLTEENIISTLRLLATKLMVEENSLRVQLQREESPEVKDKVSRAYGVLIHSYKVDTIEALNAISLLKLGVNLGWLKGVEIASLNHLFFSCRRAHLLSKFKEEVEQEKIPHKRAEFIHQTLKGALLLI